MAIDCFILKDNSPPVVFLFPEGVEEVEDDFPSGELVLNKSHLG